jgi:DNA invertase Pin-like site-specific DNA recombinase
MSSRTVLYARVSTSTQNINLQKSHAEAAGFVIDEVISDEGISGVSTKLQDRQGGKRLFDILRRGDTLVVRWVDRLGRNYIDVCDAIRQFMSKGVVIRTVINNMVFDGSTTDPMTMAVRDALIGFMAATAQAQAEATREAQRSGVDNLKALGGYRGRKPSYRKDQVAQALAMKSEGVPISTIAKSLGISRQTVYRIHSDPAEAMRIVTQWHPA